jgi:hypothetical protein
MPANSWPSFMQWLAGRVEFPAWMGRAPEQLIWARRRTHASDDPQVPIRYVLPLEAEPYRSVTAPGTGPSLLSALDEMPGCRPGGTGSGGGFPVRSAGLLQPALVTSDPQTGDLRPVTASAASRYHEHNAVLGEGR